MEDNKNKNLKGRKKIAEEQKRKNFMLTTTTKSINKFDRFIAQLGYKSRGDFIDSFQKKDFNYFAQKLLHTNVLLRQLGINVNQIAKKLNQSADIQTEELTTIIELFLLLEEHLQRVEEAIKQVK